MSNDSGRGAILLYHSVDESTLDPLYLRVTPERFEAQVHALSATFEALPLRRLLEETVAGVLQGPSIALTFDDGYANNLEIALPVLERYGVPATIFVTTGATGSAGEFWWDELERLVLRTPDLPANLQLEIDDAVRSWELPATERAQGGDWKSWEEPSIGRHVVYLDLVAAMRVLPEPRRRELLRALAEWADGRPRAEPVREGLQPSELEQLARHEAIEIGAHTRTHPVLALLSQADQADEIAGSKRDLESLVGHSIKSFAYPYGTQTDFTGETRKLVREAGFDIACTTVRGALVPATDPFGVPRIPVNDWEPATLLERIHEWMGRRDAAAAR